MTQPTILVTAAAGRTGLPLVAELRRLGFPVRAVVRRRDARSRELEAIGAEAVVADLYDPEQLADAMRGVARAYYCPPIQPFMIQGAAAFAVAAADARVEQVVLMSQWLSGPAHPALMTRQTWLADQLLAMVPGAAFTILNPGYFADNYLRLIGFAAHFGVLPSLVGDSRNAPPSNEDIAAVAAAVLADPARHDGQRYRPTGPALLSVADMAETLGRVLSRRVRPMPMPFWLLVKAARMQGVGAYQLAMLRDYNEDHRQGAFAYNAPTDDVRRVTGRPAEPFETTARRYAALPEARRSFGNAVRAAVDFARTPLMPGYNLGRMARRLAAPTPARPRFAMADEQWRADHASRPRAEVSTAAA